MAKRQRKNLSPQPFWVEGSDTELQILSFPQHREKGKNLTGGGNVLWKGKTYG